MHVPYIPWMATLRNYFENIFLVIFPQTFLFPLTGKITILGGGIWTGVSEFLGLLPGASGRRDLEHVEAHGLT